MNSKAIPTIIFATVLIFGAGVFTGGFLVNCVKSHPKKNSKVETAATNNFVAMATTNNSSGKPPRLPEVLSKQFLQRLDEELHLSADEREAIQKIISEGQNEMRKTMQDARLEIREVLTPDQRAQFDELLKRQFRRAIFATNAPTVLVSTNAGTNAP